MGPTLRFVNALLTFSFLALAVGAGAVFWVSSELDEAGPLQETRTVVIRRGEASREIAERLEREGVISSQHVFVAYYLARQLSGWFGGRPLQLKAGDYELKAAISMREVAELIGEGKVVLFRLTIPEGLTSHQIVERARADPGLAGDIETVPKEGTLLPDTYRVPRGSSRQAVIEMMQSERARFLQTAWAGRQPDLPLQSIEEAVILASIVERETGRNDKYADIASVFINRLRRGMPLQSDPTILYGLFGGQVNWGRPIYRSEISQKTDHNTYQMKGLPPTPICNPGRAAIQAVLNPSKTDYIYFVASGNGASVFSATLEEHNVAVANWRRVEKEIRAKQAEAAKEQLKSAGGADQAGQEAAAAVQPAAAATTAGAGPAAAPGADVPPLPVRKPKR
ncbi:MAG: endolytic transglycosylase MltG [Hyphomicrobiaceae bacterium]|nr:endolytic transglycosylase MltG [Hyphomicrobiaceae bacterium]